jgi:hypothetical protein
MNDEAVMCVPWTYTYIANPPRRTALYCNSQNTVTVNWPWAVVMKILEGEILHCIHGCGNQRNQIMSLQTNIAAVLFRQTFRNFRLCPHSHVMISVQLLPALLINKLHGTNHSLETNNSSNLSKIFPHFYWTRKFFTLSRVRQWP